MIDERILKSEERAIIGLRSLYKKYGYSGFKMSKFEEYDMYVTSKDFLVSDKIITFAGTDGRLLALKPDVTLSIIKNTKYSRGEKKKLCYDETVYRPSGATGEYKEIMQTGVECIGALDVNDMFELILLAAKSLAFISDDYVIDLSHMGIVSAILDACRGGEGFRREALDAISRKSAHELSAACERFSAEKEAAELLQLLLSLDSTLSDAVDLMKEKLTSQAAITALAELETLASLIDAAGLSERIRPDFSAISNMSYYNGITLSGYIPGISDRVLAGGEYSGLLSGMGRTGRAVGFAIYLDQLGALDAVASEYDVDVLLLYSDATGGEEIFRTREKLVALGKSVTAQKNADTRIRYKECVDLRKDIG